MTRFDGENEFNFFASLDIQLVERITAYPLAQLINRLEQVYFSSRWLELAENNAEGVIFSDDYKLSESEELLIEQLEIGTPNRIKIQGLLKPIVVVATVLTTILGPLNTLAEVELKHTDIILKREETELKEAETKLKEAETKLKEAETKLKEEEIKKLRAETINLLEEARRTRGEVSGMLADGEKVEIENILIKQPIYQKSQELYQQGKISEKAFKHQIEICTNLVFNSDSASSIIDKKYPAILDINVKPEQRIPSSNDPRT